MQANFIYEALEAAGYHTDVSFASVDEWASGSKKFMIRATKGKTTFGLSINLIEGIVIVVFNDYTSVVCETLYFYRECEPSVRIIPLSEGKQFYVMDVYPGEPMATTLIRMSQHLGNLESWITRPFVPSEFELDLAKFFGNQMAGKSPQAVLVRSTLEISFEGETRGFIFQNDRLTSCILAFLGWIHNVDECASWEAIEEGINRIDRFSFPSVFGYSEDENGIRGSFV